jgi:hypothetical protein
VSLDVKTLRQLLLSLTLFFPTKNLDKTDYIKVEWKLYFLTELPTALPLRLFLLTLWGQLKPALSKLAQIFIKVYVSTIWEGVDLQFH